MSLLVLALIVGILCGVMLSLVIISLLNMAQLGDSYLEALDRLARERLRFRNGRARAEAVPEIPDEKDYRDGEVSNTLELT